MNSILTDVKKVLGIQEPEECFDQDLIIHINSILMVLEQMGIGKIGFTIEDKRDTWNDFVDDVEKVAAVKSYVPLRVKQLFDPNASQAMNDATNAIIKELEWRLYITANPKTTFEEEVYDDGDLPRR